MPPYYSGNAMFFKYTKIEDMIHDDITFAVRFGNKDIAKNMLMMDASLRMREVGFDLSLAKIIEVDAETFEMKDVETEE